MIGFLGDWFVICMFGGLLLFFFCCLFIWVVLCIILDILRLELGNLVSCCIC